MAVSLSSTHIEQLPGEITLDIISRLPPKSVMQCKSVCRSWHSLLHLNHHHFSMLHLQQQKQKIASGSHQFDFLLKYKPDKYGVRGKEFQILKYINPNDNDDYEHDDDDDDDYEHDEDGDDDGGYYRVRGVDYRLMINYDYDKYKGHIFLEDSDRYFALPIGSCNGIVCVSCYNDPTHICNPLTREYINLPIHRDSRHSRGNRVGLIVSGFGYHPRTDEYKVVRICYDGRSGAGSQGQVEVYTVGKDRGRWRNKGSISHRLHSIQKGVLVNGTLYWTCTSGVEFGFDIVAFSLAEEEFYEVANTPEEWHSCRSCSCIIREFGGFLYLFSVYPSTVVWVMKNGTRNNESWVKEYSIAESWRCLDPFTITKNGDILAWNNRYDNGEVFLARYNSKTGNVKPRDEDREADVTMSCFYGAIPHIKSFISLKDIGEEDARLVGRHDGVVKVEMSLKKKASSSCLNLNVFEKLAKLDDP